MNFIENDLDSFFSDFSETITYNGINIKCLPNYSDTTSNVFNNFNTSGYKLSLNIKNSDKTLYNIKIDDVLTYNSIEYTIKDITYNYGLSELFLEEV
jgi:hypothetical protein